MAVQRRLAAILAADVAGYSRLMGEDEEGTLATLTAHLKELIEPCIAEHRGRVVKTTGDQDGDARRLESALLGSDFDSIRHGDRPRDVRDPSHELACGD